MLLPAKVIRPLYTIRWQIELIFKTHKVIQVARSRAWSHLARAVSEFQATQQITIIGHEWLRAIIQEPEEANLDDRAGYCADLGVEISAQGFDQRINPMTVKFCEAMLSQTLTHFKNTLPLPLPILHQLSAINRVDSTSLSLPASSLFVLDLEFNQELELPFY